MEPAALQFEFNPHEYLKDQKVGHVSFKLRGRKEILVPCIAHPIAHPYLGVSFMPGQLPLEEIDVDGGCSLHFDGQNTINGDIAAIELLVKKSILRRGAPQQATAEQKRRFFRVNTMAPITAQCLYVSTSAPDRHLTGNSKNLSASGVLAEFPTTVDCENLLKLQITLPGFQQTKPVTCIGRVIRTEKTDNETHLVAFYFEEIRKKDRDNILSYCLSTDVNEVHLRMKVVSCCPSD